MAKITNKLMFQSYIFTTAKYDFSVYEKRILYRQIEIEQALLSNEILKKAVKVDTSLWGDKKYTIPISMLLGSEEDKNHKRIKEAFESLRIKKIEYEDEDKYSCFGVVSSYEIQKRAKFVSWVSNSKIVEAVMDFSKGFRKYELEIAMQFESQYSMRIYELIGNKKSPITYFIKDIEEMFQLQNKYRSPNGNLNLSKLKSEILEKAKLELDKVSPFTFDYLIKDKKTVTFIPLYQEDKADKNLKTIHIDTSNLDLRVVLSEKEITAYIEEFGFTEQGLKNNYALFEDCKKTLPENYSFFLFQEIRKTVQKKGKITPAYVIGIIRNNLNDYKIQN